MGSKPNARAVVTVEGSPRSLFSIHETNKGDLYLSLKVGAEHEFADKQRAIVEQRYSVHPSNESAEKINVINHHLRVLENGKPERVNVPIQYTSAIKRDGAFAHIFSRRCIDLTDEKYKASPGGALVSLGEMDPRLFTLFYSVFVCGPRKQFPPFAKMTANATAYHGRHYTLFILWHFFSLPSSGTASYSHSASLPPEHFRGLEHVEGIGPTPGYTQDGTMTWHSSVCAGLRAEYVARWLEAVPNSEVVMSARDHFIGAIPASLLARLPSGAPK